MDKLTNYLRKHRIDQSHTQTLFWNKYPYQITIRIPHDVDFGKESFWTKYCKQYRMQKYGQYQMHEMRRIAIDEFARNLRKSSCMPKDKKSYRIMRNYRTVSVFLMQEQYIYPIIKEAGHTNITEVIFPEFPDRMDVFNDEYFTIRIMDKLFKDHYRWAVYFKSYLSASARDTIADYGKNFLTKSQCSASGKLYFNDEDDVIIAKMVLSQYINKIEKIKLRSEIIDETRDTEDTD